MIKEQIESEEILNAKIINLEKSLESSDKRAQYNESKLIEIGRAHV